MCSQTIYTGYTFSFNCKLIALSMAVVFGGRIGNVNACCILHDWFEHDPDNHLHLHYCPSHSGIEENNTINMDIKDMACYMTWQQLPCYRGTFPASYAYVKHAITNYATYTWCQEADANPRAYWGRYHLSHPLFCRLQHTCTFPLKCLGGRPTLPTMCILHSGDWAYHTCEHVLFHCNYYTRCYRYSSIDNLLQSLDLFYEASIFS
ncbi:hypothetical protein OH76DRAFT_1455643 [Lentinus brumalis]|uniref:Uncharacterized protein n=1 Tax=Lentinus brumalis TaxID=2498619 RepID=A0A371DBC0_9APHY|nr:hypothetical protein OH76DRAFT_1455643 [Polyporus brumalis]